MPVLESDIATQVLRAIALAKQKAANYTSLSLTPNLDQDTLNYYTGQAAKYTENSERLANVLGST